METRRPGRSAAERKPGAKVVHIPVHFVGSEQADRSGSAWKIQKVFRGFLARKCLKKIKDVKVEVDEIEEKLLKSDVVELVRMDEKVRMRMNESLMSLLFKLDSICGVDLGVRGLRKAVIRKAISLQERIDAIVAVDFEGNGGEIVSEEIHDSSENAGDSESCVEYKEILGDANCVGGGDNNNYKMEVEGIGEEIDDIIDVGVDREVKVISEENCFGDENGKQEKEVGNEADGNKRNRELLERMMEDNEKMLRLMTQLFERNEMQTRMINALTHRVEMLEKAFVCDGKLRKKKKMKAAASCRED